MLEQGNDITQIKEIAPDGLFTDDDLLLNMSKLLWMAIKVLSNCCISLMIQGLSR